MPYCKKCPPGDYQPEYDQTRCRQCPEGFLSPRGSKHANQCTPKPRHPCDNPGTCRNRAQCLPSPSSNSLFTCKCSEGFSGTYCDHRLDLCLSSPCENGGICRQQESSVICTCLPGYSGKYCEVAVSACDANSCENNGECVDLGGDSECECPFGYYGDRCEFKQDFCSPNPCEKGACFSAFNSYICLCPTGVIGRRCHLLPCDYHPCAANKVCENLPHLPANKSSYICKCQPGYRGENCDEIDNPCDRRPCRNNGVCKPTLLSRGPQHDYKLYDKFTCQCPVYMYGPHCDQLVTPDFVLEFPSSQVTHLVKIAGPTKNLTQFSLCSWMETRDTQNYGTILSYATENVDNMITLTDYNGLTLYVNGSHVTSDIVLNDGKWHFLCVTWDNKEGHFEMYVDGQMKFVGDNLAKGQVVIGNGVLILGQEQVCQVNIKFK